MQLLLITVALLSVLVQWSCCKEFGSPPGCLLNRLDVLPCRIVDTHTTPVPRNNEYVVYSTKIRERPLSCHIRCRGSGVQSLPTVDGDPRIYYLFSPGYGQQNYDNQQLIRYRVQCPPDHFSFFNLMSLNLEPPSCNITKTGETKCVDYLQVSRGGGDFGFVEVCGDVIPSSLQSQLDSGVVEVVMRTSDMRRFPGFTAAVVCVSTELLGRLDGWTALTASKVDEAKSLAGSVDEVNIPFNAGITYSNSVVRIVDIDTMNEIRMLPAPINRLTILDTSGSKQEFYREAPLTNGSITVFPGPGPLTRAGVFVFYTSFMTIPELGNISSQLVIPSGLEADVTATLLAGHVSQAVAQKIACNYTDSEIRLAILNQHTLNPVLATVVDVVLKCTNRTQPGRIELIAPAILLIDDQPTDANIAPGNTAVFTVLSTGVGLTYQWFMVISDAADIALTNNDATVFGATSNSLAIVEGASHEGEMYYVIITNNAGSSVTSDAVTITLDYCELLDVVSGGVIYDLPANPMTNYPSGTTATHSCFHGFGFTVDGSTRTCMDGADASGAGSWSGEPITCQLAECPELAELDNGEIRYAIDNTPNFDFNTEATHTCDNGYTRFGVEVLTCIQGNPNNIIGVWDLPSPTCDLNAPVIDNQPLNQVDINEDQDATFTVMASGVLLVYRWMKDGEPISDTDDTYSGTTSETLTVLSVDLSDEGVYSVIIANNANILSAPARLTVLLFPTITTQPLDMCVPRIMSFTLFVAASSRSLSYQWFTGSPGSGTLLTGATLNTLTLLAATELYYVVVTNAAGTATSIGATVTIVNDPGISVQPLSLASQIPGDVVTFTVLASAECGGLTYQWFMGERMLTDGAKYGGATENTLTVIYIEHPDDEGVYTVMVTSLFGTVESSVASLGILEPILIIDHPEDTTIAIGQTATFTVMVTGDLPAYQWTLDGVPLSESPRFIGVTTATLVVMMTVSGDTGTYRVRVTNAASGVVSNTATLTALTSITITTQPVDSLSVVPGDEVMFTVAVSGELPVYQWRKDGIDITDLPGAFDGATTDSLTVIDAKDGLGPYTVVVSNAVSEATSDDANLQLGMIVQFAYYGLRCIPNLDPIVIQDTVTDWAKDQCDGSMSCTGLVSVDTLGDPYRGCSKEFLVVAECPNGLVVADLLENEAHTKTFSLACN